MTRLSLRKKIVFALVPTAALLLVVVAAEIALRCMPRRFADDPYLNLQLARSVFEQTTNARGERVYVVDHPQAYKHRGVEFPVEKPAGEFRVFTLGGSASAGWPHQPEQTYQRYLEDAVRRSYPGRAIEVLDVSGHGFASYRVRTVFDDVVEFEPDLLVIWSGNNEFYEKRTYLGEARTVLESSYLLRLANVLYRRWFEPENTLSGWGTEEHTGVYDHWTRIERMAQELRADQEQFEQLVDHYTYTITHMLDAAERRGVPVILMTVPSNLRDWRPLASALDASEAIDAARLALLDGRPADAIEHLEAVDGEQPDDANTAWWLGRAHEAAGDAERALELYRRAKDYDLNPMRALSRCNRALRELASQRPGVVLFDAEREFAAAADGPAPGFDLFLDYVHPTVRGNLLVAEHLHRLIVERGLPGDEPARTDFHTDLVGDYRDERDLDMQRALGWLYAFTHQYEAARDRSAAALALLDAGGGIVRNEADRPKYREFFTRSVEVHDAYLRADLARLRGEAHDPDYAETLKRIYREDLFFFAETYQKKAALDAEK